MRCTPPSASQCSHQLPSPHFLPACFLISLLMLMLMLMLAESPPPPTPRVFNRLKLQRLLTGNLFLCIQAPTHTSGLGSTCTHSKRACIPDCCAKPIGAPRAINSLQRRLFQDSNCCFSLPLTLTPSLPLSLSLLQQNVSNKSGMPRKAS